MKRVPPRFLVGLLCWCLLYCNARVVFGSSENWEEETRLTGRGGMGDTKTFTVNHVDWRVRWEIKPSNNTGETAFLAYIFTSNGYTQWVDTIQQQGTKETSGILNIQNRSGSFHFQITTGNIETYTMIIEENTNSVLEPKGKWMGWSRYGGSINFNGEPFRYNQTYILNCRYMEWRLKWEYTKDDSIPTTFNFEIINPDTNETMYEYNNENTDKTEGTTDTLRKKGDYILFVETNTQRHFFTIEHNIESIPEFPSGFILVFFAGVCLAIVLVKMKRKETL